MDERAQECRGSRRTLLCLGLPSLGGESKGIVETRAPRIVPPQRERRGIGLLFLGVLKCWVKVWFLERERGAVESELCDRWRAGRRRRPSPKPQASASRTVAEVGWIGIAAKDQRDCR